MKLFLSDMRKRFKRKKGVALIFVMAMLALMVALGIGFATVMRMERTIASNTTSITATKLLASSALDMAVYEINYSDGNFARVDMDSEYLLSDNQQNGNDNIVCNDLLSGKFKKSGTLNYFPVEFISKNSFHDLNVLWKEMHVNPADNDNSEIFARYAYIVYNESGLIDINNAGPYAPNSGYSRTGYKAEGRTSAENLCLTNLTALAYNNNMQQISWTNLLYNRDGTNYHYYTRPSIRYSNEKIEKPQTQWNGWLPKYQTPQNLGGAGGMDVNAGLFTTHTKYVQKYGDKDRFNLMYITESNIGKNDIGPDKKSWSQILDDLEVALIDAAIPTADNNDPDVLINNMIDYVDKDTVPSLPPEEFCGESMPMISEVIISNVLKQTVAGGNYELKSTILVELWYPFVGYTNRESYTLKISDVEFTGGVFDDEAPKFENAEYEVNLSWLAQSASETNVEFAIFSFSAEDIVTYPTNPAPDEKAGEMEASMVLQLWGKDTDGNNVVLDTVGPESGTKFAVGPGIWNFLTTGDEGEIGLAAESVSDPRMNYAGTQVQGEDVWTPQKPTPLKKNGNSFYTGEDGPIASYPLYVANRDFVNTGDLAFIGRDFAYWKTIEIVNGYHGVLDTFTVHENPFVYGLININTVNDQVLATALCNAATKATFPGDTNTLEHLDWSDALDYAQGIIDNGPYTNKTDIALNNPDLFDWGADNEYKAKRESLLREFSDMVDYRGHTFTIALRAQNIKDRSSLTDETPNGVFDANFDIIVGERDLVAQIWRDPITMETEILWVKWVELDVL